MYTNDIRIINTVHKRNNEFSSEITKSNKFEC